MDALIFAVTLLLSSVFFMRLNSRDRRRFTKQLRREQRCELHWRQLAAALSANKQADEAMIERLLLQNERLHGEREVLHDNLRLVKSNIHYMYECYNALLDEVVPRLGSECAPFLNHTLSAIRLLVASAEHFSEAGDGVKQILKLLPCYVCFEGIEFQPMLAKNGDNELRLLYGVLSVQDDSPHKRYLTQHYCFYNRLLDSNCGFLYLYENITNDYQLDCAVVDCRLFLEKHKLLPDAAADNT
jgi:hypothetical protein